MPREVRVSLECTSIVGADAIRLRPARYIGTLCVTGDTVARPTVLTPEKARKAVELVGLGMPMMRVAAAIGVTIAALNTWRRKGSEDPAREPYASFAAGINQAQSDLEARCLSNIAMAGLDPKTWQANAWILERGKPEAYAGGYYRVRAKAAKRGEMDATRTAPPSPDVAAIVRYLAETRPDLLRDALSAVEAGKNDGVPTQ